MNRIDFYSISLLILLGIYLLISAPFQLKTTDQHIGQKISVQTLFQIVAEENNKIRKQWTQDIVSDGQKIGLFFGEEWHRKGEEKGPLPALFLREIAASLEKTPIALSLFLGSDFPINQTNIFNGIQNTAFQRLKNSDENQYFFDNDIKRHTAMFPDKVVVAACKNCHNEHPDTPKNDWLLNDIMGATTWTYPEDSVTRDELINIINELRSAFAKTYRLFLIKSQTFQHKPVIGNKWPVDGYFLPTEAVFMQRFKTLSSESTLHFLLQKKVITPIK